MFRVSLEDHVSMIAYLHVQVTALDVSSRQAGVAGGGRREKLSGKIFLMAQHNPMWGKLGNRG